jgi:hypothetical protein
VSVEQLDIFTVPPSTVATRGEAGLAIKPRTLELQRKVHEAIRDWGPITDERIAEVTHLNPNTARPRRLELERAGKIEAAGASRTRSGRRAVAWRVLPGSSF